MNTRRDFLNLLGLSVSLSAFPSLAFAKNPGKGPLILVELKGGNDGLNTIIPFGQQAYYDLRPNLAVSRDKVLKINSEIGFNPVCKNMHKLFQSKQMALFLGVGYPNPNFSHFRSIDIWETASSSDQFLSDGWLGKNALPNNPMSAKGFILGSNELGPLRGESENIMLLPNPQVLMRKNHKLNHFQQTRVNSSLDHILNIENQFLAMVEKVKGNKSKIPFPEIKAPRSKSARMAQAIFKILSVDPGVPLFKISVEGFDTHVNQEASHNRLLKELDDLLFYLERGLKKMGLWDRSLVMTYSEFGRRPAENAGKGTDHGSANCHFAIGGKIKANIYGKQPSLTDLDKGNLKFNMDFRELYAGILKKHFQIPTHNLAKKFKGIDFLT